MLLKIEKLKLELQKWKIKISMFFFHRDGVPKKKSPAMATIVVESRTHYVAVFVLNQRVFLADDPYAILIEVKLNCIHYELNDLEMLLFRLALSRSDTFP